MYVSSLFLLLARAKLFANAQTNNNSQKNGVKFSLSVDTVRYREIPRTPLEPSTADKH